LEPPPGERSDDALVAAARAGDVRAFEALVLRHEARVLRVLRFMGIGRDDREDLAQDVFLRVFRGLAGYRAGFVFEAWLYRVAVNAARDHRSGEARRTLNFEPLGDDLRETPGSGAAPQDQLALRDRLERALEELTDRERAVFVLKEVEGLATEEVAKALGLSSITVRRHLGRARERLKRVLSDT